ncbi:MAG: hypothetical protein WCX73_00185 [Candidatus Pacearchaeota archaeon]|jgi:flagellar motility protein MotE (MotC chaperone)
METKNPDKDKLKEIEERLKILEQEIKSLNKKLENHRHEGHGYAMID